MRSKWIIVAVLGSASFGVAPLRAQDHPTIPPFLQDGQADPKQQMIELFRKVEKRLGEIDKLLYDAGSGQAKLASAEESGILELLKQSRAGGDEVLSGIDQILEIARQQGGT